jgi:peroxiredoxin
VYAPEWALSTTEGNHIQSSDYRGSGLLLILHRGLHCVLCTRQLARVASFDKDFQNRGIGIVAVAPYWPIASELEKARKIGGIAFPLVVDPKLNVFRDYGCLNGGVALPLHGSFLIDAAGMLRWSAIGEKPFDDIKMLLAMADEYGISETPAK